MVRGNEATSKTPQEFLAALKVAGFELLEAIDFGEWRCECPICRGDQMRVERVNDDDAEVSCPTGCSPERIVDAVFAPPAPEPVPEPEPLEVDPPVSEAPSRSYGKSPKYQQSPKYQPYRATSPPAPPHEELQVARPTDEALMGELKKIRPDRQLKRNLNRYSFLLVQHFKSFPFFKRPWSQVGPVAEEVIDMWEEHSGVPHSADSLVLEAEAIWDKVDRGANECDMARAVERAKAKPFQTDLYREPVALIGALCRELSAAGVFPLSAKRAHEVTGYARLTCQRALQKLERDGQIMLVQKGTNRVTTDENGKKQKRRANKWQWTGPTDL